jgi:hypothetical protein
MITLGPQTADVRVFAYKEGLLSTVAHDLQLKLNRFEISWNPATNAWWARLEASSIEVICAMRNGVEDHLALSATNKAEILGNLRKDVLHFDRYNSVVFDSSSVSEGELSGRLTLHGVTRPVRLTLRDEPGVRVGEARLDQRDFNIRPFTALLGALKVQPEVLVRVTVPWPLNEGRPGSGG